MCSPRVANPHCPIEVNTVDSCQVATRRDHDMPPIGGGATLFDQLLYLCFSKMSVGHSQATFGLR
ncbi:MAG: hypothetical protein HW389_1982 [Bacteroidetes bacterium]|nr:hypothetical protein [Bacteroidota bacterium]